MKRLVNFIANLPLLLGMVFKAISEGLFNLSFKLHILFNTAVGQKLKEVRTFFDNMKRAQAEGAVGDDPNKLAKIIKGDTNDGLANLPKKPTDG